MGGQITGSSGGDTALLASLAIIGTVATAGLLAPAGAAGLGAAGAAAGAEALAVGGAEAAAGAGLASGAGAGLGAGTAGALTAAELATMGGAEAGLVGLAPEAAAIAAPEAIGAAVPFGAGPSATGMFAALPDAAIMSDVGPITYSAGSTAAPSIGLGPIGAGPTVSTPITASTGVIDVGAPVSSGFDVGAEMMGPSGPISLTEGPGFWSTLGGKLPTLDQTYKGAVIGTTALGAGKALLTPDPSRMPKAGAVGISAGPWRGPTARSSIDTLQKAIELRRRQQHMPWVPRG